MNKKNNILIAGPLPPPAGGISIHIERLHHLLSADFNVDLIDESPQQKQGLFNIRSGNVFGYLKKMKQCELVFIHSGNRLFKKIHILTALLLRKKILLTLHGYGHKRNGIMRWYDSFLFNKAHGIILVNEGIFQKLHLNKAICKVRHAFLPPVMENEPVLPPQIKDFIGEARSKQKTIICGNASRLDTFNNQDLYGLDMFVTLAQALQQNNCQAAFIFNVSALDAGKDRFDKALKEIQAHGLEQDFLLLNEKISFSRLIESSDIMLRPTNTDGDSLSIREGLFLEKKVITSDAVSRPEGCILFKTRDNEDLLKKVEMTLAAVNKEAATPTQNTGKQDDLLDFYQQIITDILNPKK